MRVELVGGVHDGRCKEVSRSPGTMIWVEVKGEGRTAAMTFFRAKTDSRHLYEFVNETKTSTDEQKLLYLYRGDLKTLCRGCGAFHDKGHEKCTLCGASLSGSTAT